MKKENGTTWLHISDLHILLNSPSWETYEAYFFEFFTDKKPEFVVITGDYRNIQKREPFELAKNFIRRLKTDFQLDDDSLFMIPGNHDTEPKREHDDRERELKKLLPVGLSPWAKIEKSEISKWLEKCESEPKDYLDRLCNIQRSDEENENAVFIDCLLRDFSRYERMATELIPWYDGIGWRPQAPHKRVWRSSNGNELGFNIVHLNTAIVSDGSRCHYEAIDLNETLKTLSKVDTNLPTLILAHNSFYDLHPQIREQLVSSLSSARVCAWLCGDAHQFSEQESIVCPAIGDSAKEGSYEVPIFVCGKGAPDHGDSYSENGFYLYTFDGNDLSVERCKWILSSGIKAEFLGKKPLSNPDVATIAAKKTEQLYIGYFGCTPSIPPEEKYHLGHAYFIHCIDKWKENHNVMLFTSSYIFMHNRSLNSVQKESDYAKKLVQRWDDCFDREIKVIDIKRYLQEDNPLDESEKSLLCYIAEMEMKLDRDQKWMGFIEDWSENGDISPLAYKSIKEIMGITGSTVTYTQDEVMSFAYLLYKRPTWYSEPWLVNFMHFWNAQLPQLIRDELELELKPEEVFIVESRRNHYVWDAISYCAKRFAYINFPKVEYLENLLGKNCRKPMKSSDRDNVVFLSGQGAVKDYSDMFRNHVKDMFQVDKKPAELCEEYGKRLGITYKERDDL